MKKSQIYFRDMSKQQGATLIVALIILAVLTILGVSNSQSVLLQEKMTFSVQDAHVALQSAELGIAEAEAFIEANVDVNKSNFADDGQGTQVGLYTQGNGPADIFDSSTWLSTNSQQAGATVHSDVPAPRFIIEDTGISDEASDATSVNIQGYGQSTGQGSVNGFRIIAQGKGRANETERYVISYYGMRL
ncbi:MAG: hypothetical protein C9356_19715 [Oleiphilus sp.]|nr:MAG: hypothetical protein C9356_19715 [Oleiphilus sp.]